MGPIGPNTADSTPTSTDTTPQNNSPLRHKDDDDDDQQQQLQSHPGQQNMATAAAAVMNPRVDHMHLQALTRATISSDNSALPRIKLALPEQQKRDRGSATTSHDERPLRDIAYKRPFTQEESSSIAPASISLNPEQPQIPVVTVPTVQRQRGGQFNVIWQQYSRVGDINPKTKRHRAKCSHCGEEMEGRVDAMYRHLAQRCKGIPLERRQYWADEDRKRVVSRIEGKGKGDPEEHSTDSENSGDELAESRGPVKGLEVTKKRKISTGSGLSIQGVTNLAPRSYNESSNSPASARHDSPSIITQRRNSLASLNLQPSVLPPQSYFPPSKLHAQQQYQHQYVYTAVPPMPGALPTPITSESYPQSITPRYPPHSQPPPATQIEEPARKKPSSTHSDQTIDSPIEMPALPSPNVALPPPTLPHTIAPRPAVLMHQHQPASHGPLEANSAPQRSLDLQHRPSTHSRSSSRSSISSILNQDAMTRAPPPSHTHMQHRVQYRPSQPSPVTTSVIDSTLGAPAIGLGVGLHRLSYTAEWTLVGAQRTDSQGRCNDLFAGAEIIAGTYRLSFDVEEYMRRQRGGGPSSFFQMAETSFRLDGGFERHHVSLLLNGNSYTIFRS